MAAQAQNFRLYAGETKTITVTATNEQTGALLDFSGATIVWKVKQGSTTILTKQTGGSGISVTGTGIFTITIDTGDTTSLSGNYPHECRATLADGTVATLLVGTMTVDTTLTA